MATTEGSSGCVRLLYLSSSREGGEVTAVRQVGITKAVLGAYDGDAHELGLVRVKENGISVVVY